MFIPEYVELADLAIIYKGKGINVIWKIIVECVLVTIFKSILMRLTYFDNHQVFDSLGSWPCILNKQEAELELWRSPIQVLLHTIVH
jgi:hypothetical protein